MMRRVGAALVVVAARAASAYGGGRASPAPQLGRRGLAARAASAYGGGRASPAPQLGRRGLLSRGAPAACGAAAALLQSPRQSVAAQRSLADLLAAKDPTLLRKPVFNVPPGPTPYPDWLRGDWTTRATFAGYVFPSSAKVSRERIVADVDVPGFQKCSIAQLADVGRDATQYTLRFAPDPSSRGGAVLLEDRRANLAQSIGAFMGDPGIVRRVDYDAAANPNRCTINLRPGARNGERIELFFNARRHETSPAGNFLCSESIRQVTLGGPTASTPNVARIVIGEYQHFWTFRPPRPDDGAVLANVLTASYIQPQDPIFPEVFDAPVVVFSHNLDMRPAAGAA